MLTPKEVLWKGLALASINPEACKTEKQMIYKFKKEYGLEPLDVASVWYDLVVGQNDVASLLPKEISTRGFKMFLMAISFLWNAPKNCTALSNKFKVGERNCRGAPFWYWVEKIAALKEKKIVWDDTGEEIFFVTVDGVDFKVWEPQHKTLNRDPKKMSHKCKHGAYKCEIAISVHRPQVMWISGPHDGGKNDYTIFKEELENKIPEGKLAITDRGYGGQSKGKVSAPSAHDSKELNKFKARARCRQETFNARIKKFAAMANDWRFGKEKHKLAFEATVVLCQYRMDNGYPLYDA